MSAPGGDDGLNCSCNDEDTSALDSKEGSPDDKPSEFQIAQCSSDCAQAIIGPVLFPPNGDAYWSTHYGFWNGT